MILFKLILILFCLLGLAFFSGIETGIIAIDRLRLMHRARNGSTSARIIEGFLRQSDRLLGTTLVGNNIANTVIATLAASLAQDRWGNQGQAIVGFVVVIVILVCGEYLPKAWFLSRPLERSLPFARTLRTVETILKPIASFIMKVTQWVVPARDNGPKRTVFVTREHLHLLTRDSEAGGQISTFERLMIGRVLDLQMKTAAEVMTPISKVAKVSETATLADAVECLRQRGHMKLPVLSEDGTRCIGVLYTQEVLGNLPEAGAEPVTRHMHQPFFLKEDVRADDVLPLLRRNRQHLAIIRNESGKVLGIVTVENILTILVGNLPASASGDRKTEPSPAIVVPPQV